jgi:ribosomal protein S18 acetylase RimI-like enzyme
MTAPISIRRATSPQDLDCARNLFEAYAASLEFDLGFQGFSDELERFPGEYTPPDGCLLIAEGEGGIGGCVGLRKIEDGVCEMKRLYVAPALRGRGAGRALAIAVIEEGRRLGYDRMRLDTVPSMTAARALYSSLGFTPIEPYRHNPVQGTAYMECALSRA